MITDSSSVTKASTERERNLPDMRHLFHRRTDERGETFPSRLANDAQSATKSRAAFIAGSSGKDAQISASG